MKRRQAHRPSRRRRVKLPEIKVVTGTVDPSQLFVRSDVVIDPPKGYVFSAFERSATKWKITYVKEVP
jgi:hypothetical protein